MKIIDRCMKRRRSRRPAHVVDRIRADDPAKSAALLERMRAAGLDTSRRVRPPTTENDYRQVSLQVVKWWAVMVDEFAAQQGISPEKFMGDILTEGLYEVYLEFMAQKNAAARAAAPKALDDDIPF